MIALTTRLNERDETILQMQEELDTYDKIHKESENEKFYHKKKVQLLEDYLRRHRFEVPKFSEEELGNYDMASEKVRVGDCETFNITYSNLVSHQEKIKELSQIADSRKSQIEQLQDQIKNMEADSFQANQSRNYRNGKGSEMSNYESQNIEDISVIASSVNDIIQKLSQQNSADVLKHVAKKLLDLQKFTSDILTAR